MFDDWHAAGPNADDEWRRYEKERGHGYVEALAGLAARHVFGWDKDNLDAADIGVLALPAGKSGHLEAGYLIGQGKPVYILLDKDYDRWDVMLGLATGVVASVEELVTELRSAFPTVGLE